MLRRLEEFNFILLFARKNMFTFITPTMFPVVSCFFIFIFKPRGIGIRFSVQIVSGIEVIDGSQLNWTTVMFSTVILKLFRLLVTKVS